MKKGFLTTIIILILIQISLSGCFDNSSTNQSQPEITALEGKEIADEIAYEWHNDSVLTEVGEIGGESHKWYYWYYSPTTTIVEDNIINYDFAKIYVTSKDETEMTTTFYAITAIGEPIRNWTIDSDEAVNIAKQDSQISSFLSKYPDSDPGMNLQMWYEDRDNAVWSIRWSAEEWLDNPKNAHIELDAHTGDIILVEVFYD